MVQYSAENMIHSIPVHKCQSAIIIVIHIVPYDVAFEANQIVPDNLLLL